MLVKELMNARPATILPTASINDAYQMMQKLDVRHLPVVKKDSIIGMLSDRDVQVFSLARLGILEEEEAAVLCSLSIEKIMESELITVTPDTPIIDAVELFITHRIGALPVVAPNSMQLVGIISYIDVLSAARQFFQLRCAPH